MKKKLRRWASVLILSLLVAAVGIAQSESSDDYPTAPQEMVESTGVTDLMWAAGRLSVEELRHVINAKPDIDPAARDDFGNTALHWVAFYATDPEAIDLLLDLGVPVDIVNAQGFTAFEIIQGNENLRSSEAYMRLLSAKLSAHDGE